MGIVDSWTFTRPDMEVFVDDIKAIVVRELVDEGQIDRDIGNEWCKMHTLIFRKRGWFRTMLEKVVKSDDGDNFIVVKRR